MDMPTIISVIQNGDQTKAVLNLRISPELDVFEGHFEDAPIVPGVVQIYWALQLANQYLKPLSTLSITHMEAVKFQRVMIPNVETTLDLELVHNKLLFVFRSESVRFSSGRIVITT